MSKVKRAEGSTENYILASLPREELEELKPFMQAVRFKPEEEIYRSNETFEYIYFPTTAMTAWIATTSEGERVEVGVVGWEGVVGVTELLGYKASPFTVECELPGEAVRIRTDRFKEKFNRSPHLQKILFRYTCAALTQLAQSSVCNRFHEVEQRICRLLLMAHDRCGGDELNLTQEILAGMIGARRPAVSIVIGNLQRANLIRNERGRITILDREGMEKASCECYRVIRESFDRFTEQNEN